jgi:hypothetical protein
VDPTRQRVPVPESRAVDNRSTDCGMQPCRP